MKSQANLRDWGRGLEVCVPENGSGKQSSLTEVVGREKEYLEEEAEAHVEDATPAVAEDIDSHVRRAGGTEGEEVGDSLSDVGFFLSMAARYPLLSARREKQLASTLWRARRSLARAIELAYRSPGTLPTQASKQEDLPARRITPGARRRLMGAEEYAATLLQLVEGGGLEQQGRNGSHAFVALPKPPRRRGRRPGLRWARPLTRKQVLALAPIFREELAKIHAVREELAEHNLRLVIWVAKSYRGRGLDLVDLIQEGSMGLLRAIDRFDPAVGTRFSTFATHWVRQGIGRSLAEKARAIRIPLNRLPEVREAVTTQTRLSDRLNRTPTLDEIAEAMNARIDKVKELLPALSPMDSLDAPSGFGDHNHADTMTDRSVPSPLEQAMEDEMVRSVKKLLERMPERERLILAMRYGIGYPRECTLEEIGQTLGLSRERIRQIEKAAREEFRDQWTHSVGGRRPGSSTQESEDLGPSALFR